MGKLMWSALALAIALLAWKFLPGSDPAAADAGRDAQGPVPVLTAAVETREFLDTVTALGTAQANEAVDISAKVSDHITALHFSDGAQVQAGQLLVEIASEEQQAAVREAEVNLAEAQRLYARLKGSATATARTQLEEQQSKIGAAEAQLAGAKARLAERRITAPFAGVLGLRLVSPGDLATPGMLLTTLDDLSVIKVDFSVPEAYLAGLAPGQVVEARSDVFPGTVFAGRVSVVNTRIDPVTRAVAVRALIPNPEGKLQPGLLLTITLIKQRGDALSVPESALVPVKDKQFVFLVEAGKAKRAEIRIGRRRPGQVEVLSGLSPGQIVVTEGTLRLRDGSAVTTQPRG